MGTRDAGAENGHACDEQLIESAVPSLFAERHAAEGRVWLLDRRDLRSEVAASVRRHTAAAGGMTLAAEWRAGFDRPFGPLLDLVEASAAYLHDRRPEVLGRLQWTLSNLLYPWRKAANLYRVGELRAGLAELGLRGDTRFVHEFFQKRNVKPQILAYMVHLIVGAAREMSEETRGPVVLQLENAHLADALTLSALRLLRCNAQQHRVPMKICLVGESVAAAAAFGGLARGMAEPGWTTAMLRGTGAQSSPAALEGFTEEELDALRAASAYALPYRPDDWLEHLPPGLTRTAEALMDRLLRDGVLTQVGPERITFSRGDVRDAVHAACPPDVVASLHRELLDGEEAADPFAAAWHGAEAGSPKRRTLFLEAMERAWALSAYECALTFARAAFDVPAEADRIDSNLVLALLNYEAGEYAAADRLLDAAIEAPDPIVETDLIRYLKGYNAVFGTGEYARGIRLLGTVLDAYEQKGDVRTAAYVKNTMAYAHFRSRNFDDAVREEEMNIRELHTEDISDSFLQSILQLNLGRLYNHIGDANRAVATVEAGLHARRKELSSHTLLLCYATLASVQAAVRRQNEALANYRHMFELVRNMQLDSVKDQVVFALSKLAPHVPGDRMTRTDEILFYLHFHLARTFEHLGLPSWAQPFREAALAAAGAGGADFGRSVVEALEASPSQASPEDAQFPRAPFVNGVLDSFQSLVRSSAPARGAADALAEILALGGTAAVLDEHLAGGRVPVLQSVVLYDPRSVETAERVSGEFGGSHIRKATAAFVLPAGLGLFVDVEPRCGVQQVAMATRECCSWMPGLAVGVNVQVVSEELDGIVYHVVRSFFDRTGVPVVAAAPFHLWRGDLVTTPHGAVLDLLVTSLDRLYLAGRVVEKVHGRDAVQNIVRFRPRVSEEALVYENRGACLIRIKRRGGYAGDQILKVHPEARRIIDLCDGSRDFGTLAAQLTRAGQPASPEGEKLASLLRGLWRNGALCFDPPVEESARAGSAIPA